MTFSYDLGLSQPKDQVRLLLQDTSSDAALLQNEEITFMLDQASANIYGAAALGAQVIANRYSQAADKQVGDLRISYSNRSKQYADRAAEFAERAGTTGAPAVVPYAGGVSITDKQLDEQNEDLVGSYFGEGQHDNPPHNPNDPLVSPRP